MGREVIVSAAYPMQPGASIGAMLHGIDHIAIATDDPDAAAQELELRLGLAASGGGRHEGLGTRNRLIWLADGSYLELIGLEDAEEARSWHMGTATVDALAAGGGLAAYALDDRPLEADVNTLRGYGSQIGDPVHGSRIRPDGEIVEWWTAVPPRIGPNGLPFLIEHAMNGAEWGTDALAERAAYVHPIGSPVVLVRLDLRATAPADSAAEHARQLGMAFQSVAEAAVCSVGRHVIRLLQPPELERSVVITLGADAEPRVVDTLGVRFVVERVERLHAEDAEPGLGDSGVQGS